MQSRDVLAHFAGADKEALEAKLIEECGMDKVDLAEVWLRRVAGDAGAMLHGLAGVGIAFDAEAGDEANRGSGGLAERVRRACVDGGDSWVHVVIVATLRQACAFERDAGTCWYEIAGGDGRALVCG